MATPPPHPTPLSIDRITPAQRKTFDDFKRIVFDNESLKKPGANNQLASSDGSGYWNSVSSWWYGSSTQQQETTTTTTTTTTSSISSSISSWWSGSSTPTTPTTPNSAPTKNEKEEAQSYWKAAGSAVATLTDEEVNAYLKYRDDDLFLLRFVNFCDYDLEKSVKMFRNFLRWRIDFKVDDITKEYLLSIPHPSKPGKLLVDDELVLMMGHDKWGVATIYLQVAKIEPGVYNYDDVIRCFVYIMELFVTRNVKALNLTFNYHEWGLSNVDRELDKRLLHVGQHYYPGILNMAFLVDSPWIFRGVWNFISLFLQEGVTRRIKMISQDELQQYYSADQIPSALGGQCVGFSMKEFILDPESVLASISIQ